MVRRIPAGSVTTYGAVAAMLGMVRAARAVGRAMMLTPDTERIPWQRVVNAKGMISIGGNPERPGLQRKLLEREGIRFDAAGRIDMKKYFWTADRRGGGNGAHR